MFIIVNVHHNKCLNVGDFCCVKYVESETQSQMQSSLTLEDKMQRFRQKEQKRQCQGSSVFDV